MTWAGDYAGLGGVLDDAEKIAARLRDDARLLRVHATRVHLLNMLGRHDDAIALGENARASARRSGDANLMVTSTFYTGQSYFNAGKLEVAERTLSENLDEVAASSSAGHEPGTAPTATETKFNDHNLRTIVPQTYGTRAMTRAFLGAFSRAHDDVAHTIRLAEATGRAYDRVFALAVCGIVELHHRHASAAEAAFRAAMALADSAQVAQLTPPLLAGLGHTLLLGTDLPAATEVLTAAHRLSRDSRRATSHVSAATGLALSSLRLGEPDLARRFADEAVELAQRLGLRGYGVHALRARGLVLAATSGLEDEGLEVLEAARQEAAALGMAADVAHGHAALAASGAADAAAHLEAAGAAYAALGMADWSAQVRTAITSGETPYL